MPIVSTTRGYKGRGEFKLRPLAGGKPFMLGNVTSWSEAVEVNRTSRQNYQTAAGGELDVEEIVTAFTFEANVDDISPQNIALGLSGLVDGVETAAVADEKIDAWLDIVSDFRYIPDPDVAPTVAIDATAAPATDTAYVVGDVVLESTRAYLCVVAGTSDASAPTWPTDLSTVVDGGVTWKDLGPVALVEDTDYSVSKHGIKMLSATADRFSGELPIPLNVGYTRNKQYVIQALVSSQLEYEATWLGLNSVDNGNPLKGKYFRIKFSPTSGFGRHGGDDFASLTLSGTVLADPDRGSATESAYHETLMI